MLLLTDAEVFTEVTINKIKKSGDYLRKTDQ